MRLKQTVEERKISNQMNPAFAKKKKSLRKDNDFSSHSIIFSFTFYITILATSEQHSIFPECKS